MNHRYSERICSTQKSFIREILKVTADPEIISFAGGLPNPNLIDDEGIQRAAAALLKEDGKTALQYSTTEGHPPLREWIAERYRTRYGLSVSADQILITNGSQQCLDLIGKVYLDKGDSVIVEDPGYLGAIQSFSMFQAEFLPVPLNEEGPDLERLTTVLETSSAKFMYGIPNSQNPSGITYSENRRKDLAAILCDHDMPFVEDDAYGELQFDGVTRKPVSAYMGGEGILTGSFSKIFSPGMRMGWVCAPEEVMEKILIAKQASDLHSNYLSQRILSKYLEENDIDAHIAVINEEYRKRAGWMISQMEKCFPDDVQFTRPTGGMFIWLTLPEGVSSSELFDAALKRKVAILPGTPFYADGGGDSTARINFSNADKEDIMAGIEIVAEVLEEIRSTPQ
ncbi:PLP-dependent aminotransferase family protein [Methanogenium sp. MK-MG]|uniref:aminotransferase-like domain-containing protein n=1 Tax=Methanogenium sp. MK-MG TaxID=2599926 RepID=UPI0013EABD6F|nr:PLP-dependent aminotransferase family protein [Methanogenium sp. MK-MG]KAF1073247.1 Aromatic-amino-acid aminotransferase 1 [Methanogenium sp. MK-MG]